ncbi:MAG: type I DNA topoisomerase [Eubacteriales bacterium]
MANLVIVESPAKASTIKGYLGSTYKVVASKGHVRDLPKSTLGVNIESGFEPHYINISGKGDIIRQLKKEAKGAKKIFLATDPDREGEAISWHLATALGIPQDAKCRVSFNEITKGAIKDAIKHPRAIDIDLVNSQQARRILDRIVGYKLSPFLWKTVKSGLSAGRVQSVATRMIVEREEEIRRFEPKEYWSLDAKLQTASGVGLTAAFWGDEKGKIKLENEAQTMAVVRALGESPFRVSVYKKAQRSKHPAPPFITSTMQQEASRKLGFQSQRIMKVAQELYEGINLGAAYGGVQGLITYMRTDSLRVSEGAQQAALALIAETFGEAYVPKAPRVYKSRANAQDAHEAIRPSDVTIRPGQIKKMLTADQYKLYKLIWERFVASQMSSAVLDTISIDMTCQGYLFRAAGYSVRFRGYLAAYENAAGEEVEEDEMKQMQMPQLSEGEMLQLLALDKGQHFTEPPARYNDASLIKMLEESGIGRPSTYTTIITTIIARSYVKREGKSLVPTPLGEITTRLMKEHFPDIVDEKFTAHMEERLDNIEQGGTTSRQVLEQFYGGFSRALEAAAEYAAQHQVEIPPEESPYTCENCGGPMVYKNGRFGRFLACGNYPTCKTTKRIDKSGAPVNKEDSRPELAGFPCEVCGADMVVRKGKYGTFYACSNYPKCKFTKQKPNETGVPCPVCGARVVTKYSRGKRLFYSCERYPDCDFSSWDMPLAEKCPDCGQTLYYRKGKKLVVCKNKDCQYQREQEWDAGE